MKILVVEDDRKVAGFIEQGLKEEGYVVDIAPDGEEATMLAHVYEYDVILLDVVLPKKNGFQVATELRREGRNTPILMLTSRDAVEDVVRGHAVTAEPLGEDGRPLLPAPDEAALLVVERALQHGRVRELSLIHI